MTRLYEEVIDDTPYPNRKALRNFTWTRDAISDWEDIWHELWYLGYKWEWQNSDRYARRFGERYNLFACHNDAIRLDMTIPLPGIVVLYEVRESLLDHPGDDNGLAHAVGDIDTWLKKHYTPT